MTTYERKSNDLATPLSWERPAPLLDAVEHAEKYQSDSGIPGTYVPNMSEADRVKWKAKKIGGEDPRVEIRKGFPHGVLALIVVRRRPPTNTITMSMNGKAEFTLQDWTDMAFGVAEAKQALDYNS